jgi:hypothetical protein
MSGGAESAGITEKHGNQSALCIPNGGARKRASRIVVIGGPISTG